MREKVEENEPMITITKERAELKAFITGFLTDPAHDNQSSRSLTAEVFRIALASLEAEPVSFDDLRDAVAEVSGGPAMEWSDIYKGHQAVPFINFNSLARIVDKFRAAPPAPVVPDEWEQWIADAVEYLEGGLEADGELEAEGSIEAKRLLFRRAAMLQSFGNPEQLEPVTTAYKLPEGWVAVPVNATRAMIDAAARVEEDGYDAMHKAMIAAAPQQEETAKPKK